MGRARTRVLAPRFAAVEANRHARHGEGIGSSKTRSVSRLVVSPKKPAADDQRDAEREKREVPSKLVTAFVDV
jgi:hypothetical protein